MKNYDEDYVDKKVKEIRYNAENIWPLNIALNLYEYSNIYHYVNRLYNELADKVTNHLLNDVPLDKDEIMADLQVGMFYRDNESLDGKMIRITIMEDIKKLEEEREND